MGAGTGFLALLLAELGHRVTGVDLAPGMLALARAKAARLPAGAVRPVFAPGDAVDPPLPAGSVDAVISRHLLWTLTEPQRAFANWRRLLRPGGRVVAIDGLWHGGRQQAPEPEPAPSAPGTGQPGQPGQAGEAGPRPASGGRRRGPATTPTRCGPPSPSTSRRRSTRSSPPPRRPDSGGCASPRLEEVDRAQNEAHPERPPRRPRYVLTATDGG